MKGIMPFLALAMLMGDMMYPRVHKIIERELTDIEKDQAIADYKKESNQKYKKHQLPKKMRKKLGV
jgi:hypothetical protein